MLDLTPETSANQRFSLYALPLIASLALLIFYLLSMSPLIKTFNTRSSWELLVLIPNLFFKIGEKFALILAMAYYFKVNVFSLKNSTVTAIIVIIVEMIASGLTSSVFHFLERAEVYYLSYFIGAIFGLLIQLFCYIWGFWLLFKFPKTSIDRFEGTVIRSSIYWRFANFLILFFVIHFTSSNLIGIYNFFGSRYSIVAEPMIGDWIDIAVGIILLFLVCTKMKLQRLEIRVIVHTGFFLGFCITAMLILFDWMIFQADNSATMDEFVVILIGSAALYLVFLIALITLTVKKRFSE